MRGTRDSGKAGLGLDYEHRLNKRHALFAHGELWKGWGFNPELAYEAIAGWRMRF